MHCHPTRCCLLLAVLALAPAALLPAQESGKRRPVPDKAAQAKALKDVLEVFQEDIAKAKEPAAMSRLATEFLKQARENKATDVPVCFVLYREGRDLAARAGDVAQAFQAVDEMTAEFDLPALDLKADVLVTAEKAVTEPEPSKALTEQALQLIGEAVDADNYPVALRLGEVAEAAAKKSRVIALLASVRKRNQEVLAVKKGFDRLQPFLDRLKKDPKDAQANFKLGQYFGLLKGKWERALPLLALGSDEALKALAARDLARPKDGKDQLAVADGWWDLAAKQKDPAQLHMLLRAGYWYEQAALNVTGLSRTKALKRIEKIAALGQPAVPVRPPGKVGHIRTFEGSGDEVKSVAFSPDARSAVSGGKDNTVRLWDLVGGKEIRSFKGHTKEIWTVAFHPNGRQVFSASWDATVRLWDVAGGKDPRTFTHPKDVNGLAVTRDGQWLLTGCDDETMRLWSLASGQVTKTYTGHSGYVYGVAFSADGKYVGSGGQDRTVRVYDRTSGQKVREITGPTGPTYIVAFSPDGRYVFSCGDSAARMWEVATGKEIRKFEGKGSSGYVNCLALSQDGRRLVTGHEDKSVRLWDVATGKELQRFEGHTDSVECVAISADGFHALSGGKDRTIRLWGLP